MTGNTVKTPPAAIFPDANRVHYTRARDVKSSSAEKTLALWARPYAKDDLW